MELNCPECHKPFRMPAQRYERARMAICPYCWASFPKQVAAGGAAEAQPAVAQSAPATPPVPTASPAVGNPHPAHGRCGGWHAQKAWGAGACTTTRSGGFSIFALLTGLAAIGLLMITGFGVAHVKHHAEAVFATDVPLEVMPKVAMLPLLALLPAGILFLLNLWSRRRATVNGYCGRGFATVGIIATLIVSGMSVSMHSRLSDISEPWEQLSEQAQMGVPTAIAKVDGILINADEPSKIYHAMEIKALVDLPTVVETVHAQNPLHRKMAIRVLGQVDANLYADLFETALLTDESDEVRIQAVRTLSRTPVAVEAYQALFDANQKAMLVNNGRAERDVPVLVAMARELKHLRWDPAANELLRTLQSHPTRAVKAAALSRDRAGCFSKECGSSVSVTVTDGDCDEDDCHQRCERGCKTQQHESLEPAHGKQPAQIPAEEPSRIYTPGKPEPITPALPVPVPGATETEERPELPPFNEAEDF